MRIENRKRFANWCGALLLGLGVTPVLADSLEISIEIPRLDVAEYHNPYIAIWLEDQSNQATQLAVWYDTALANGQGTEWLKDMRQWWRRGGRSLDMSTDGLSSATRGPGVHRVMFSFDDARLAGLEPGNYRLRIEASREVGGREVVEIPLQMPVTQSVQREESGTSELGRISIRLQP